MLTTFRRRLTEAGKRNAAARLSFVARELTGGVVAALGARMEMRRNAGWSPKMSSGKGVGSMETLLQDLRYSLRVMLRNPAFTLTAVFVLALGIGANTAIFSAVDAVILRPLPFPHPERLFAIYETNPEKGWVKAQAAPANVLDWREQVNVFEDVAAYSEGSSQSALTGAGEPRLLRTTSVTGNFFSTLGVRAQLGRALTDEETWKSGEVPVVLSHKGWTDVFASDPHIIGRSMKLDGQPARVVGVMPKSFAFPAEEVEAWSPYGFDPKNRAEVWFRRAHWLRPIARVRPGVTPQEANAQLQTVVNRLKQQYPVTNKYMGAGMTDLHEWVVGDTRVPLLVLLGAVGLLLLIACANVGNLLLVKAAARNRELAVRSALGAGRGRLVRQMLTESLVLSMVAGAYGLALGWLGTRVLSVMQPPRMLNVHTFALDPRVVTYTIIVTGVSALLFGVAPALWSSSAKIGEVLKQSGRSGSAGRRTRHVADAMVVAEIALAVLLVLGAGLLVRSFWKLQQVEAGFQSAGVLAVTLNLPAAKYDTDEKVAAFFHELQERVQRIPKVDAVGATTGLPLTGIGWTSDFSVAGRALDAYGTEVGHRQVMPGYFRTMHVPLLRGRTFTDADRAGAPRVVLINQTLAKKFFAGQDPVGQRITFDKVPDAKSTWRTIVGVVGDERIRELAMQPTIEFIAPAMQDASTYMSLVLHTRGSPAALTPAVRRVVAEMDPELPIFAVRTMDEVRAASVARQRFIMSILLVFAGVALVLAIVGVYGVTAQVARQRRQEIGIRVALGAQRRDVLALVVRQAVGVIGFGLVIGLVTAALASRAMSSMLYETAPTDAATYFGVALILAVSALIASSLPGLRATRVDPARALRVN
jgi:predicted permease